MKLNKKKYLCSLKSMNFSDKDLVKIYNFYLYKSFAASSPQSIKIQDYGWKATKSCTNGYGAIENALKNKMNIEFHFQKDKKGEKKKSFKQLLLENNMSDTNFDSKKPNAVFELSNPKEPPMVCLFRHIRNAIAHGNTYQFENNNILLEDKYKGKLTARILIKHETLIDWIKVIDKNNILKEIK